MIRVGLRVLVIVAAMATAAMCKADTSHANLLCGLSDADSRIISTDLIEITSHVIESPNRHKPYEIASALHRRGDARLWLGQLDGAKLDYVEASRLNPQEPNIILDILGIEAKCLDQGANEALLEPLIGKAEALVAQYPRFGDGWAFLAGLRAHGGNFKTASVALDEALRVDVQSAFVHRKASLIALRLNDWQSALAHSNAAIRLDPTQAGEDSPYVVRAQALLKTGDPDRAQQNLRFVAALSQISPSVGLSLCDAYEAMGFSGAAFYEVNRLNRLFPKDPQVNARSRVLKARNAERIHDHFNGDGKLSHRTMRFNFSVEEMRLLPAEEVVEATGRVLAHLRLDAAQSIQSYRQWALIGRAEAHLRAGHADFAVSDLAQLVKCDPTEHDYVLAFAIALCRCSKFEESRLQLDNLLRINPDDLRAHVVRAELTLAEGNDVQAIKCADRCLELDRECSTAYYIRGVARLNLKQYRDARSDLEEATFLDPMVSAPNIGEAYLHLGLVRAKSNGLDAAIPCYLLAQHFSGTSADLDIMVWQAYDEAGRTDMGLYLAERMSRMYRYEPRVEAAVAVSRRKALR